MTQLERTTWGNTPTIYVSFAYEKRRIGADMQYRVQITVEAVTGVRYFGYPIYSQISLDGLLKDTYTIKNASPSQWSSSYVYTTDWITVASKTSGTTALKIRVYSGMGTTRDISYNYELPTDPAASVVSVQNGTMGQNVTILLTRYNNSFTHTLKYSFGAASGTITTGLQANTYTWQIPISLANQVPASTSGTGTITLITYNGSTEMGRTTATFTASVPSSVVPTISGVAISDAVSGIAEQFSGYVQRKSKLSIAITAAGAYNSTIQTIETTVEGAKYSGAAVTTNVITGSGTITVSITVKDSRGRTASATRQVTVIAYAAPSISAFSAFRADEDGNADDNGTYLGFRLTYAIYPVNNHNTKNVKIQYKKASDANWSTAEQYTDYSKTVNSVSTTEILDVDYSYQVRVTAADWFGTVTKNLGEEIPTSGNVFDIFRTGKGFALGKAAEGEVFECDMDAEFGGSVAVDGETIEDHIVAAGTSGNWRYRKYHSGQAEMWYYGTVETTEDNVYAGTTLHYTDLITLTTPFAVANAVTVGTVSSNGLYIGNAGGSFANQNISFRIFRDGAITAGDKYIYLHTFGTWR